MSLQDSTFNTAHILDNEIVKANDFEFSFEKVVENVAKATQMILESNQDFVINGKVLPYQGMNVKVSPIYGVCKSTGIPFGRTEEAVIEYGFEESTSGRIDIIEVHGEWETYDNQQRAFNDPDTNIQTYQYVDTKKLMRPAYKIKKGVEGSSVAPEVDDGYVKLAEVVIRANNSEIDEEDIKNITADIAGLANTDWTTQPDITYNIGYISDINERFRVQHNEDGTHKENVIDTDSLNMGTGAKQVNGNVLPIGASITIPTQTTTASDTIVSTISKAVTVITSLYDNYLKYGTYGFKGELSVSDIVNDVDELVKPITIKAAGDGTALIKIDGNTVLTIDANGKLSTNGYTATLNNHVVTKAVTDAISTSLSNLASRVTNIENTLGSQEVYINKTLSTDRFLVASITIVAATTANITLSGVQTIDGISLTAGQNVLVKNQTNAKNNGIYTVQTSNWTRPTDYNTPNKLKGKIFNINNGTSNGGKMYYTPTETFSDGGNFGSDDINFVEFLGSVAKLANKLVMRDSSGAAKLDVIGNVTGNVTGNVSGDAGGNAATSTTSNNTYSINKAITCSTVATDASKTVSLSGFSLNKGAKLLINIATTNTKNTALTLNVNSTGAKTIKLNGTVTSASHYGLSAGLYNCYYDGTYWCMDSGYEATNARNANYATSAGSATTAGSATNASNLGTYNETKLNNILVGSATPTNYQTKTAYAVGAYVWYNNKLYRCVTAVPSTSTSWTAANWVEVVPLPISVNSATSANTATSASKLTTARKVYVKLGTASTTETKDFSGDTAIPVNGTLALANGGTGSSTADGARTNLGLDTAAQKAAGSAAGNVPLVGTALGSTDNNILVTNTNGEMKPFGKTPNNIAYWGNGGAVCSTAAATGAKTAAISGFALYTGVTVKVMFTNGNTNNAPTLNVNSTGAKNIKVVKAGQKITPPTHTGKWRGASTATTEGWQPLTTLELMYDGTDWVIIGNPVVEDYYTDTQSYTVYANGLIKQWGRTKTTNNNPITFNIIFSNTVMSANIILQQTNSDASCVYSYTTSSMMPPRNGTYFWDAIGY